MDRRGRSRAGPGSSSSYPKAEYSPELTGTRNGYLYGYFPSKTTTFIARLDQKTGKALKT